MRANGGWRKNFSLSVKQVRRFLYGLWAISMIMLSGGCAGPVGSAAEESPAPKAALTAVSAGPFRYQEYPVTVTPANKPYTVAGDLGNITNKDMFSFSPGARNLLIKNGFVVVPGQNREFFMLYEMNSYEPVPSFITADSMLHNYHLFFSHLLRVVETEKLAPALKELSTAMLAESRRQYAGLKGTDWENAAQRNMGFYAVGASLLDPGAAVPPEVQAEVKKELALIAGHQGVALSPVMNTGGGQDELSALKEDYSQYIPRGHYDRTEQLQAYFKAMMWYGRQTFRIKNQDEVKSAVLVALALEKGQNRQEWEKVYQPTVFFVGQSDDLSCTMIRGLLDSIYGPGADLPKVMSDQAKWASFMEAAGKLDPPAINSIPVFDESIQPDRDQEVKGFRFMGQRFTLDAAVFQRLVYREVKEDSQGRRRMLPSGLDIPAAMGSGEAYAILQSMGETGYRDYSLNMDRMKGYINSLDSGAWTQNLYWAWLYSLKPLTTDTPAGYPSFMRSQAWARKQLNTYLGSWTELKHDTVLYAKQVYAECGGGDERVDDRGYVEPNPLLYARLASLAKMTREGLRSQGLLGDTDGESLSRMEELALQLKAISEKELNNTPLTDGEYQLIRAYGGSLEHFWLEALKDEGIDHRSAISDRPAALVTDVATDIAGGRVLQEATGAIYDIYAVVPVDGKLRIAKGGVYSYYEFTSPLAGRLTDKEWHTRLDSGQSPDLPQWTGSFVSP